MERDFYFGNWLFDRTDRKLVSCGPIRKSGYSISDRNLLVLSQYGQKIIICRLKMTQRHVYYSKILQYFPNLQIRLPWISLNQMNFLCANLFIILFMTVISLNDGFAVILGFTHFLQMTAKAVFGCCAVKFVVSKRILRISHAWTDSLPYSHTKNPPSTQVWGILILFRTVLQRGLRLGCCHFRKTENTAQPVK